MKLVVINFTNIGREAFLVIFFQQKKKLQTGSTEHLRITLLYNKAPCKMLMKLTPGVNFTNILTQSANALVVIPMGQQSFFCSIQFHQQNCAQLY